MTDPEIRLRCIELAMEQAKREQKHGDTDYVAKLTTWFYTLTQGNGNPAAGERNNASGRGKKTDKSVFD